MMCRHVCYKLNCFSYTNNHLKCDSSPHLWRDRSDLMSLMKLWVAVLMSSIFMLRLFLIHSLDRQMSLYFISIYTWGNCQCSLTKHHSALKRPVGDLSFSDFGAGLTDQSIQVCVTHWPLNNCLWGNFFFFSCKVNSSDWRLIVHPQIYQDTLVSISPKCQH